CGASFLLRFAQTCIDFCALGRLASECRGNSKVFFEQWKPSIKNFQLIAILRVRISLGVQITNTRNVFESLRAHRTGIHAQSAPDCAWNSFHPFEPSKICRSRRVSDLPQLYARACSDFAPVDPNFLKIAAVWMNDYPADAAVSHEKIRASSDNKQRQMFVAAKTNQLREGLFRARLDPKLRGTANPQSCMVRERLVKAGLPLFASNFFFFFLGFTCSGADLELFMDVAGPET